MTANNFFDQSKYLQQEIPKFLSGPTKLHRYFLTYLFMCGKRFLIFTFMIFAFQFLLVFTYDILPPALPLYLPIGMSFTMFYLLGNQAFWGLCLAECLALYAKQVQPITWFLYLVADLGLGFLAAMLCQKILSSDLRPFSNSKDRIRFIQTTIYISCISSLLRLNAYIWGDKTAALSATAESLNHTTPITSVHRSILQMIYYYFNYWLADLNALISFAAFILSWAYVFNSREKVSPLPIPIFIIFCAALALGLPKVDLFYFSFLTVSASLLWAYLFGYLAATALLFLFSIGFFEMMILNRHSIIGNLGIGIYTLLSFFLLFYSLIILWIGHIQEHGIRFPIFERLFARLNCFQRPS